MFCLLQFALWASPLAVNESRPSLNLKNQYDKAVSPKEEKYWVIVRDKSVSYLVNDYFLQHPHHINSGKVVYILNIEKIPYLIYKFFVKSKMREFPFEIMICDDDSISRQLPYIKDKITVIYFKNQRAKQINFVDTSLTLEQALHSKI